MTAVPDDVSALVDGGLPSRTLAVLHVAEMSGPARSLRDRIAWLAEHGDVELVVPGAGPAADLYSGIATVTELEYRALTLPGSPGKAAQEAMRLRREVVAFRRRMRASRPELVVCATAMLPAVLLAARRERVPVLLYAAEILSAGRSPLRRLGGRGLVRIAGTSAHAVAACSATVAAQYPEAKTAVVPPPIPDAFAGGDGDGFRRRHGIPSDAPLVLAVGSLSAGRGQDVLLESIGRVRERRPATACAVVGVPFQREVDLAYERRLRRVAAGLGGGMAPAVIFCGYEPRIADAYAAATMVVNPARSPEAFGRVCCEALAAARPVIATGVGAIPEVLKNGETAELVPPDDPQALAEAIASLLSDPDRARARAEAGRRDVLERFAPERSLASFKRQVTTVMLSAVEPPAP